MEVSTIALVAFFGQCLGYVLFSSALEHFYFLDPSQREKWKLQAKAPARGSVRLQTSDHWGFPLYQLLTGFRNKHTNAHPYHHFFTTFNLFLSATFAGFVGECFARDLTPLYRNTSVLETLLGLVKAVLLQSVLEYYWHRLMHISWFYRTFHKYHHHYKAPTVWCDLFIHPLEAFGYYWILYSPALFISIPTMSFLIYMMIMGICGVMDHCGVRLSFFGGFYRVAFHDTHHRLFNVNYAFPFDFMDILHDTLAHEPRPFEATPEVAESSSD